MNKDGYVLGIGAANVDVCGVMKKEISMRDSNPGSVVVSVGGVTHNILSNFVRMGGNAKIITAVGDDVYAGVIVKDCQDAGLDTSHILHIENSPSATYLAALDNTGDMLIGVSALETQESITPEILKAKQGVIDGSKLIVCDTSLSDKALEYIVSGAVEGKPIFADPVSKANSRRLKNIVSKIHTVTPNLVELEEMSGIKVTKESDLGRAVSILLDKGTNCVIVTLGKDGCYYRDKTGISIRKKFRAVEKMDNATGAGDAFMSGIVYGFVNGYDVEKTLDIALAAGIIAIQSSFTINPRMSIELIEKTIKDYKL